MRSRRRLITACAAQMLMAPALSALGTATARADSADYPSVVPDHELRFPRDHGAHPEWRIEWWYLTAWLDSDSGPFGVQLTFFRSRTPYARTNPSRFAARQLYFGHAAIADPSIGSLLHVEQAWREGDEVASASTDTSVVKLGRSNRRWSLELAARDMQADGTAIDRYHATLKDTEFSFDFDVTTTRPPALQGDEGFSRKGPRITQASYYYSRPQLALNGHLEHRGRKRAVRGTGWLDHEWSSELMDPQATGWDWTGLNLYDGTALMAFRMRRSSGDGVLWNTARRWYPTRDPDAWRGEDVDVRFEPMRRWRSPRTGAQYPVAMRLVAGDLDVVIEPLFDDQELDSQASTGVIYWEGAVRVMSYRADPVSGYEKTATELGRGYLELTGYASPVPL